MPFPCCRLCSVFTAFLPYGPFTILSLLETHQILCSLVFYVLVVQDFTGLLITFLLTMKLAWELQVLGSTGLLQEIETERSDEKNEVNLNLRALIYRFTVLFSLSLRFTLLQPPGTVLISSP